MPQENLHITLDFIGEIKDANSLGIFRAAASEIASGVSSNSSIEINGFGCFPSSDNPRILWAGISGGISFLQTLSSEIIRYLKTKHIYLPDNHLKKNSQFIPHITVARIKKLSLPSINFIKKILSSTLTATFYPDGIHLMESCLKPSGAIYKTIFYAPFKKGESQR